MNRYQASAELKNLAKDRLTGKFGTAILIFLMPMILSNAVSDICSRIIPAGTMAGAVFYIVLSFLLAGVTGVFNVGTTYFFLNLACGQPGSVSNLFYGFQEQPGKSLALSFVFAALDLVCMTPMQYYSSALLATRDQHYVPYLLAAGVIGLLIYVPVSLAISQTFFLMLDFPNWSVKDTLKGSLRIMKGNMGRLFYLEISFLPLMLLCLFSLGIGFLWLIPYMNMTMTFFFLDLMNSRKR